MTLFVRRVYVSRVYMRRVIGEWWGVGTCECLPDYPNPKIPCAGGGDGDIAQLWCPTKVCLLLCPWDLFDHSPSSCQMEITRCTTPGWVVITVAVDDQHGSSTTNHPPNLSSVRLKESWCTAALHVQDRVSNLGVERC